ncbi:hypothetical protein POSPLADRAFT_1096379, partial [Postia placenta MAD-698-R-SB12]
MQTGMQLRNLFVMLLIHCHPVEPAVLWNQFKDRICDNLRHRLIQTGIEDRSEAQVWDYGLF